MPSAIASTDEVAPQDYYPDLSAEDKELLKQLDATVDRMRTCLPDVPYVQTIPQDEPRYHHYSQQSAEQWLRETPFNRREHPNIQYQTWIYHEPHSNCIYLERSMRTEEAPQHLPVKSSAPQSAVGTPNVGPKKKISLAAYKNKQAGGADNTPEPQATENARAKAVKTEEQESKRTSERQGTVRKEAPAVSQTPKDSSAQNVLKRKREADADKPTSASQSKKEEPTVPVKKPRMSPTPRSNALPPPLSPLPSPPKKRDLPSKLSPLQQLPSRLSPLHHLPERLSPTLPPKIVAALEARAHKRSTSGSSSSSGKPSIVDMQRSNSKHDSVVSNSTDSVQDKLSSEDVLVKKENPPQEKEQGQTSAHSPRSTKQAELPQKEHKNKAHSPGEAPVPLKKELPNVVDDSRRITGDRPVNSQDERETLVVTLKIPKTLRTAVKRLLGMRPSPQHWKDKMARYEAEARDDAHVERNSVSEKTAPRLAGKALKRSVDTKEEPIKGIARKVPASSGAYKTLERERASSITSSGTTKRSRTDEEDPTSQPQAKRKKGPDSIKLERNSSTPLEPAFKSPTLTNSQRAQSQQVTPTARRDLRTSIAMQRVESTDSVGNSPSAAAHTPAANHTSATSSHLARENSTIRPSPSSGVRTQQTQAWEEEKTRFITLGRKVKHLASDHEIKKERDLAAIAAVESFLTFILAFYCDELAYVSRNPPQLSNCLNSWSTLHSFYAFVKRLTTPYPHLYGLVCHLGVVYNSRIIEACAATKTGSGLRDAWNTLKSSSADANAKLRLDVLMHEYPAIWRAATEVHTADEGVGPEPGKYAGGFTLPIGADTGPLQAVRFGRALLDEWCKKQGVKYAPKLLL